MCSRDNDDALTSESFLFYFIFQKYLLSLETVYSRYTDNALMSQSFFLIFFSARRALPAVIDCGKSAVERWHCVYYAEFARGWRAASAEGTSSAGSSSGRSLLAL